MRLFLVLFLVFFISCSSGSDNKIKDNNNILSWEQPPCFVDNSYMDVSKEIECFAIYCSDNILDFYTNNDNICPFVYIKAIDNNNNVINSINLIVDNNISNKFISVRSVSIHNLYSDFSEPVFNEVDNAYLL